MGRFVFVASEMVVDKEGDEVITGSLLILAKILQHIRRLQLNGVPACAFLESGSHYLLELRGLDQLAEPFPVEPVQSSGLEDDLADAFNLLLLGQQWDVVDVVSVAFSQEILYELVEFLGEGFG